MFNTKELAATPGLSRRLLEIASFNDISLDQGIKDLAQKELIENSDFGESGITLDEVSLKTLQYVMDWKGRAMILEEGNVKSRQIALASIWLRGGRTLILCQPKDYLSWAKMIKRVWPESSISVFGNPRHVDHSVKNLPAGLSFKESPDYSADFFLTNYSGVIWNSFFNHTQVDQTIVEELAYHQTINYRWDDAITGMFKEAPSPLFLQDIHLLPTDHGKDILFCLGNPKSRTIQHISDNVFSLMKAGVGSPSVFYDHVRNDDAQYLSKRGYKGIDQFKLMSLFGVSSHLLDEEKIKKPIIRFDDTVSKRLKTNSSSVANRIAEKEERLEESTGRSIRRIVSDALAGDRPSIGIIGDLRTHRWNTLKAKLIKSIHSDLTTKMTRSLILVDNKDLLGSLKLHFSSFEEVLNESQHQLVMVSRFAGSECFDAETRAEFYKVLSNYKREYYPISNLFVSFDDLINYPVLLDVANYLFITEWPLDRDEYQGLKSVTEMKGTRLVGSVITDTFEEEIFKQIS